jgi:uncharacterized membrane protein YagU involved in acid resistance
MNFWLAGSLAGFVATAHMTAAMLLMHRRLPRRERYPLPPAEITSKIAREAGVHKHIDETRRHLSATVLSHFGYGAAAGTLYAPLSRQLPGPPLLKGVAFGLVVWTGSYLGLLPALGILRPATEHPARRNALMIAAHVVWGSVLGLLTDALDSEPQ